MELSTYCTSSDFLKAIETISEDISVVGLPPIIKYNENDPVPTVVSLINSIWFLLQQRQQLVDSKRNVEQKATNLSQKLLYFEQKQKQLESSLHHNEDILNEKKKQLLISAQNEIESTKKIKSLKQEVQEMNKQMKSKDCQFKHELKRQQIEIASLQSKLRGILSKEKGYKWRGPTDSSVERKSFSSNEELLKKCICRLENNVQLLVKENLELRKLLDSVSSEMAGLIEARKKQDNNIT